jgi:hypothetical protein
MSIQCCVERTLQEEQETTPPDKEADVVKIAPAIPWYANAPLMPPPQIVTTLQRSVSNATTVPN